MLANLAPGPIFTPVPQKPWLHKRILVPRQTFNGMIDLSRCMGKSPRTPLAENPAMVNSSGSFRKPLWLSVKRFAQLGYIVACQRSGVSNKPTLGSGQRQDTGPGILKGALHPCPHATVTWSPWEGCTRQYIQIPAITSYTISFTDVV